MRMTVVRRYVYLRKKHAMFSTMRGTGLQLRLVLLASSLNWGSLELAYIHVLSPT